MSTQKLRLAIVGAGLIARNSHIPAALGSTKVEITAIVDPAEDRARQIADEFGISPRIAADIGQIPESYDAAVICTPNHTHASIAITCLTAAKHVMIDKPMATSVAEAESILGAAKQGNAIVAIGYATRFRENVVLMKELLDAQAFGPLRSFVNRFGTAGGWSPKSGYILHKEKSGGGVLVVSGTHFLDRMLYWWGYPDSCSLTTDSAGGPEANCRAYFKYSNQSKRLYGLAIYSKTTQLPAGTVIDTERGFIMLGELDSSELIFRPHDRPGTEHVIRRRGNREFITGIGSFELQMDDFIQACLCGGSPRVDGKQGLQSMQLLEDLYGSCQTLNTDWYSREKN